MPSLWLAAKRRWCCSTTDKAAQSSRAATHFCLAGKCKSASIWVCLHHDHVAICGMSFQTLVHTACQCIVLDDYNAGFVCDRSGKTLLAMALLMAGTLTAAANVWGVKRINSRMLHQVGPRASELLGREVCTTHHTSHMPCHA